MTTPHPSHAERVADAVRAECARRRITQHQLAKSLGLSQMAVSRRLSGAVALDVNELYAVAQLLDITPAELIGDAA